MSWFRWLPTLLGFPLGGLLAIHTAGSVGGPVSGALAGLVAGAVLGVVQWLALRGLGIGLVWVLATAVGTSVGAALAAALTGGAHSVGALVLGGLVTGAFVGAAQAVAWRPGRRAAAIWAATVSLSWALGWLVTANVIVDAERGYVLFGSSGALLVTVLTGAVLHRLAATGAAAGSGAANQLATQR
ncbi:hypothetical protein ACPPVT_13105 [Angustibacter sp. McL0619]|uniref:hypothetical protein n=1 Tax=Angustibacter sp. McL0619 TaxID=3415676 RepID=UPI003CF2B490